MFQERSPDALVGEIEECHRSESMLIARRLSAVAALLWHRTAEAEGAPSADPGHALITGFARTSAEVSAAMNLSPKAASQLVGHAEALDTRLPEVARLLAVGRIDWRTAHLIITRTDLVDGGLMPLLDRLMADRIDSWQCWSRRRVINAVDAAVRDIDPEAAKERRVTADTARSISIVAQPNGMASCAAASPLPLQPSSTSASQSWPPQFAPVIRALSTSVGSMHCSPSARAAPSRAIAPMPTAPVVSMANTPLPQGS
jgi:hypothetical protein